MENDDEYGTVVSEKIYTFYDSTVNSTISDIDLYNNITVDTSTTWNGSVDHAMTFPGDIKFHSNDGSEISLAETLNRINERLAIIEPDFEKMERFPALRKAYEHYKTIEAMIQDDTDSE